MDSEPNCNAPLPCDKEVFSPKFDANGLLTAVVVDVKSREVVMLAHMNAEALARTVETKIAHFYSRSRRCLWKKGESSGNVIHVLDIWVDCDQDAIVLHAQPSGPACHTGAVSCFFRRLENGKLITLND